MFTKISSGDFNGCYMFEASQEEVDNISDEHCEAQDWRCRGAGGVNVELSDKDVEGG